MTDPIYVDLASESDEPHVTIIESLCFVCYKNGETKFLMTKIPHYREIIISSFCCDHCGNKNSKVQPGSFQDLGVNYEVKINNLQDLSRQIIRSEHAVISIPMIEFEIPADGDRGEITNVEGLLSKAIEGLNQNQPQRKQLNEEVFQQIENFIKKLMDLLELKESFTLIVDDPTGNSYVESLEAPNLDSKIQLKSYERNREHNIHLGLISEDDDNLNSIEEEDGKPLNLKEEVLSFNTLCDNCSSPCLTKMKVTDIPHFKESVIMCTQCDHCGHKTNEVKGGGGISEKGRKLTLHIKLENYKLDIARDILKSETCAVRIPELDLDAGAGVVVGKFTTVEGLLRDIQDGLGRNPFLSGDAVLSTKKDKMDEILCKFDEIISGSVEATLILDDPAGNSYLQDLYYPENDPYLDIEDYVRSYEQDEDLGINDMKLENYGTIEEETLQS